MAKMPSYKLTYFNVTALGEPIRFLLSYGQIPFEDHRIENDQTQWPQLKPSMPFGQMPVLEIDGKRIHQSLAICRYLGKQFKIAGSNDWESLQIDIMANTINDLRAKIRNYHYEPDEKIKASVGEQLIKEILPYYLERLDKIAHENNGNFANKKLSWADMYFTALLKYLNFILKFDMIEKYPNLQAVQKNVEELPAIKKYLANRPKTDM